MSFPERWRTLIRRLDPAGEGSLELHFDGIPIPGLFAALRSATVRVENARVEAQRGGDAVAGSFTFYPQRDSWTFDGDTLVSWVRGLRLPPSRWEGRASASRFEMRRLPEPGIPGRMELDLLLLPGDEGLEFTVRVADAAMGTMLGSGLEGGRWSLLTTGSWQHETGLETVTEIEWEGLVLPPGTPWPARGLQGPVSGYVRARRDFDDMRLERIRVRDDETLWEGSGRVRGDGVWVVTGRASSRRLLPRFLAPLPVSPSLDPGEGVEFEIRGPFLEWDLLRP